MSRLYLDASEFLKNPIRTGIQRVVRKLIEQWPTEISLDFVSFDLQKNAFVLVPTKLMDLAINASDDPYSSEDQLKVDIKYLITQFDQEAYIKASDVLFVPEMFVDKIRSELITSLQSKGVIIALIVYDLIPWIKPWAVNISILGGLNFYKQTVIKADKRCYISEQVRNDFFQRIIRCEVDHSEPVMTLGADGLASPLLEVGQSAGPFVCPGAFDGRKGQEMVFDAFLNNPACGNHRLVFAGRVPASPSKVLQPLLNYQGDRIKVIDNPSDTELAVIIASARATIFTSQYEGFGLPAVESLYLGTPVVVDEGLPSIADMPRFGQIRLTTVDRAHVSGAFTELADDEFAQRLRDDVGRLSLPTWRNFSRKVAEWVRG